MKAERPEIVKDEYLQYLDELRESGVTNMFGAAVYSNQILVLSRKEAKVVLVYWMETFGEEDR